MDPTTSFSEEPFTMGGSAADEISKQERIEELERQISMLKRRCTFLESKMIHQDPRMKIVRDITGTDRFDEVPWKVYKVSDDVDEIDQLLEKLGAQDPEKRKSLFVVKMNSKPDTANWITVGEKKIKLSLIPPAVRFPGVSIMIGPKCCVNPWIFYREMSELRRAGLCDYYRPIFLSEGCPVVMPRHLKQDILNAHKVSGQKSCLEADGTISLTSEMKTNGGISLLEYMTAKTFARKGHDEFGAEYKRTMTDYFFDSLKLTRADFFEVVGIWDKYLYCDRECFGSPTSIEMIWKNMKDVIYAKKYLGKVRGDNLTLVCVDSDDQEVEDSLPLPF